MRTMAQHARKLLRLPGGLLLSGGAAVSLWAVPNALAEKDEKAAAKELRADRLFDPEALERGAKALREINKSPYAKQVCI